MTEDLTEKERAELTAVMYNNIFTNEVATGAVCELLGLLEERSVYRHKAKWWGGKCREEMRGYNRMLNRRTGWRLDYVADLNDVYDDVVKDDVWKLGNVVRMRLGKWGCRDTELTARMWLARMLVNCALHNNDHCFDGFPHLRHYHRRFAWMRLTRLANSVVRLELELMRLGALDVELEERLKKDGMVETGFRALAAKLHDGDRIIEVCNRHAEEWDGEV